MSMFRRRLLMYQALMNKSNVINYPGLIAAWSAKGKTNDDKDRAILKDLTGNGHDITLNGFSFSEMSGYGGYKTNMLNWKYNKNSAVILSSQNKFITYNTLEITTHFWDYVNKPPLGTIHRPSFKLKISGLNEDEVIYYRYYDGEDFSIRHDNIELRNGINVFPEINAEIVTEKLPYTTVFEIQSQRILDKEITFEILPEYPDALVFDGVDDKLEAFNIIPLNDGYTLIIKRILLENNKGCTSSLINNNFKFEYENAKGTYSYGKDTYLSYDKIPKLISWQTANSYNNIVLDISGNIINNNNTNFVIGSLRGQIQYANMVFYSAYLFDRSLDEQEIKSFIRKYIDPEYLLPSEIPTPDCYYDFSKDSNDDETRDTIKDYSGNGNDAVAHNFAWSGMSGYGGYNLLIPSPQKNRFEYEQINGKFIFKKALANGSYLFIIPSTSVYGDFDISINNIGTRIIKIINSSDETILKEYNANGVYTIKKEEIANISIVIKTNYAENQGMNDLTIEFLPLYPGALVFDGADDYVSLDAFDSGFKTVFMKFKPINTINAGYYDQIKKGQNPYYFSISGGSFDIAFTYRNTNGKTYINGILNTSILAKDVVNKTVCVGIVNENVTADNTTIPKIGDGTHFTPWFANMTLYKFLGFKEALTEEQIQAVIKKYNLLDGVDEIEVS